MLTVATICALSMALAVLLEPGRLPRA